MPKLTYAARLLGEFVRYAREKKSYWIVPVIIVLAVASIVVLGGQVVAPALYTLF